ncbi:MAG TPA: hypothetical protein VG733_01565, partial [Chthoniobacteraceae bacterium]|nr:hypothetical protein [Chthoniobacteraceae bacterium]
MKRPAPTFSRSRPALLAAALCFTMSHMARAQDWPCYGCNPQHTSTSPENSQAPLVVHWSAPVDMNPPSTGGNLYIHYGSPVITDANTVLVPVKTGSTDGFEVLAYSYKASGTLSKVWTMTTDYSAPACAWIPICGISLAPGDISLAVPAAGGTVLVRQSPDSATGVATRLAFYGIANYNSNPGAFAAAIKICTPITTDASGNLYFGYVSNGALLPGYPSGIPSGLARIGSNGSGTFTAASAMSGDATTQSVLYNCAPALGNN